MGSWLVLDHDMVCLSDLGEYFDEDFEGNLLMGRLFGEGNTLGLRMRGRGGQPESLAHAEDYPYFFLGPMLSLAAMRGENTWETFLAVHEVLQQEEQIALTAATGERTIGVDRKWNQVPQSDNKKDEEGNEVCGITLEGIIHWTGGGKPWHLGTKIWRPEVWEAERTNWEVLRAGEWDKPVMWELSGSPASELQHRQWCRPKESAGALAEGVDYLEGPWSGEMPEECELLGWKAEPVKVKRKGRKPHEALEVSG